MLFDLGICLWLYNAVCWAFEWVKGLYCEDRLIFIQNILLLFTAIGAYVSFRKSISDYKRSSSVNQIIQKNDKTFLEYYYQYRDLINQDFEFKKLNDEEYQDEKKAVRHVLSHYEFVAICIKRRIFDESIFIDLAGDNIISIYHNSKDYIKELWQKEGWSEGSFKKRNWDKDIGKITYGSLYWLVEIKWKKSYQNYKDKLTNK